MIDGMFGWSDLKKQIAFRDLGYVCPVGGCSTRLTERQTGKLRADLKYGCAEHGLILAPSTFEYQRWDRNLLWGDYGELRAHTSKREIRIARDDSEDAVTWNVFRFLERQGLLLPYLATLVGAPLQHGNVVFWSHDRETGKPWAPLMAAREQFELNPARGLEPDVLVVTDRCLFVIEAKLVAGNRTVPGSPLSREKYVAGGDGWWQTAFAAGCDYAEIAERDEKSELMRLWLLGTWMAAQQPTIDFRLVNVLRDQARSESDIETRFRKHLPEHLKTKFVRTTWEGIGQFVQAQAPESADKEKFLRYFSEKTMGYRNGVLQRAFQDSASAVRMSGLGS